MTQARTVALSHNHRLMFFSRALLNVRMFNVVLSLFYLARGLSLAQIFYANIFWAVATLLFEIPSSYLADYWGRKKTILLGCFFAIMQWLIFFFGYGFFWMALGAVFFGLFYACFSGTDSALIYDTDKELGEEHRTLRSLGSYESARYLLKIGAPLIASVIAKDLLDWQFHALIAVDIVLSVIAIVFVARLTEPDHKMDVHKMESGIMQDAWNMFGKNPYLFRVMMNKELVYLGSLILYLSFQAFLVARGMSVFVLGIGSALFALSAFLWNRHIGRQEAAKPGQHVQRLNMLFLVTSVLLLVGVFFSWAPLILLICIELLFFFETARSALYSEIFHKHFFSFNRATTLSLSNMLHNMAQIPMFFFLGIIIGIDTRFPFIVVALTGLVAVVFFRLRPTRLSTAETGV